MEGGRGMGKGKRGWARDGEECSGGIGTPPVPNRADREIADGRWIASSTPDDGRVAKLIRAARYYGSYVAPRFSFPWKARKAPNDSSLLMASVYDIKLFVRDNGTVAMRTDNYFELRNRGMGFYMGITGRNHSRVCARTERRSRRGMAAFRLFSPSRFIAPAANGKTKSRL